MKFSATYLSVLLFGAATAVKLNVPSNPRSGAVTEITWTIEARDPPTWGLFLMNSTQAFGLKGILAEAVDASAGSLSVTLPQVTPASIYILKAVNQTNVDQSLGWSPVFAIPA
ncbi:hypothetical protein C8J56DRAFT_1166907 [Mycena floridula]|nr:hypothetical protein C8J56DRAFT_1166907 [Mycena floridula]